jgi:hypothetical protein
MTACLPLLLAHQRTVVHLRIMSHSGMASHEARACRREAQAGRIPRSGLFQPSIAYWLRRQLSVIDS